MQSFRYLFVSSVFIADRESTFIDRFVSFNSVRKVAQIYSACMLEKLAPSACYSHSTKAINYISVGALKGQCPDYAHAQASSVFPSKDNRTVILTRQDFLPDRTVHGDLLFTFSSNILSQVFRI